MEMHLKSHSFAKIILCRKRCHHCEKSIRFFGLRCRNCRIKCHKSCSDLTQHNCYPGRERRLGQTKASFFRRPFAERNRNKKRKLDGISTGQRQKSREQSQSVDTSRWKPGLQQSLCTNVIDQHRSPRSPNVNLNSPSEIPTCSAYGETYGVLSEDAYGFEENFQNSWYLSATPYARSFSESRCGLTPPPSAVSSGYSSVNQSCASSAGTGSQRSRSPTPDRFDTVREESVPGSVFGGRLLGHGASSGDTCPRYVEGKACCARWDACTQSGADKSTTAYIGETPLFFLESDEDSSGEWEERENSDRLKQKPGLRRKLRELEIRYSDLEIDRKVGVGPNGPVYRGRWHGDVMVHTRQASEQKEVEEFRKEVALLSMIRHENVMLLMGACLEPPNLAVVTSLRKCLSIHNHLHCQESRLSLASRLNIMLQVAQGMSYLHAKCITVPCLRTMNIYLESKVKLCINDYTYLHHQVKREGYSSVPQGHLTYLAPEVISKVNADVSTGKIIDPTVRNRKMDVYAFGTVMYEILTDKWPYANLCPETVIWMIGKGLPQSLAKVKGPDSVKDLMKSCWSLHPAQRPSFVNIIQVLKQKNLPTNHIARRHSLSEPEKIHCIGKMSDLCRLKRI